MFAVSSQLLRRGVAVLRRRVSFLLMFVFPLLGFGQSAPPLSGDQLYGLLASHRESPSVKAMLEWSGSSLKPVDENKVYGNGFGFTFEHDRLKEIALFVQPNMEGRQWRHALPVGITAQATKADLLKLPNWTANSDGTQAGVRATRNIGGREIGGFTVRAELVNSKLDHLVLSVDLEPFWREYTKMVQEVMPVEQFTPMSWGSVLAGDLASDPVSILAAWVGLGLGEQQAGRAGLHITLTDHRWVDVISFAPIFKGGRLFGLGPMATSADVEKLFGPPDGTRGEQRNWRIGFEDRPPLYVNILPPASTESATPNLLIQHQRQEVVKWKALMTAVGDPSPGLVKEIAFLWQQALGEPDALLGRAQQGSGLLGSYTWWKTKTNLQGVISGTVRDEEELGKTRIVSYILRRYRVPDGPTAASDLGRFGDSFNGFISDEWESRRRVAENNLPEALIWEKKGADFLEPGPSLSLEARDVQGGSDLALVIRVPMD